MRLLLLLLPMSSFGTIERRATHSANGCNVSVHLTYARYSHKKIGQEQTGEPAKQSHILVVL